MRDFPTSPGSRGFFPLSAEQAAYAVLVAWLRRPSAREGI